MKHLVVLPHADPTLRPLPPDGWQVVDVAGAFAARAADPLRLAAHAAALEGLSNPTGPRQALLAKAAAFILARTEASSSEARLRALGAAFSSLSTRSLELRLDDLELHGGSTERSTDVIRAAEQALPFAPELASAVEALAGAERIRLWVERDQQLPAVAALARALPDHVALELDGPFAHRHAAHLPKLDVLRRARLASDGLALEQRVVSTIDPTQLGPALESASSPALLWRDEASAGFPTGAWAGHVALSELDAIGPETKCRALALGLASVGETVVGADGSSCRLESLQALLRRLSEAGVSLAIEWWVGAPGESAAAHEGTLRAFDEGVLAPARLAGLRPFHWSRHRARAPFADRAVSFGEAAEDRDLSRSIPFSCPGSLEESERAAFIEALAARASARHPLVPGRVALAYCARPEDVVRGDRVRLAPSTAIVALPTSLDGKPQPTWYAVQLRTRATLAMDPRIAPRLAELSGASRVDEALPLLSAALRERVVRQLIEKGILEEVG